MDEYNILVYLQKIKLNLIFESNKGVTFFLFFLKTLYTCVLQADINLWEGFEKIKKW